MNDKIDLKDNRQREKAERIAFDHLVAVRLHLDSLSLAINRFEKDSTALNTTVLLRHAYVDVRMIIEEIMLLSVSAHKDSGKTVTENLRKSYQADKKMTLLRKINARFFPDAIDIFPSKENNIEGQFFPVTEDYLTEKEAESFYRRSNDKLHASWKISSKSDQQSETDNLKRFLKISERLLRTFEIDISGQGYIMLGHINFGTDKPPELFFARQEK